RECAQSLGMSVVETAHGIVELANAAMANAFRLISVQRGYDPRGFVLVAFGGAGPLHANRMAQAMGIKELVIPRSPGVFSSVGLVATDVRTDEQMAVLTSTARLTDGRVGDSFKALEEKGWASLQAQRVSSTEIRHIRQADMRYVGQGYELTIDVPEHADILRRLEADFHAEHERAFGFSAVEDPTEVVNLRVSTIGSIRPPTLRSAAETGDLVSARKGTRMAFFAETGGFVETGVFDRALLWEGATVGGPALIEEFDSTTVVCPGHTARVAAHGMIIVEPDS
ncbi:MAG: hydantoinase/oxoprolinase family protein, partial [Acidimicrobiia bacterium]|nr:hydantoinase/oxoprolinase family protein [Acidimicrobiia bacterium]